MPRKKSKRKDMIPSSIAFSVPAVDVSCILRAQVARYEVIATISGVNITAQNLIATINLMAATTTSVYSTFYGFRIRKITFYTPAVVSSATSEMAFEWYTQPGSLFGSQPSSVVLGSTGTGAGGKHVFIPPKTSQWSKWFTVTSPGSTPCFLYSVPAGTTVDVEYDASIDNNDATVNFTVVGAVVGTNYRMGLDGLAQATSNWIPIGYKRI